MAEKDVTEKLLEDYPDVFADIVNVLVYDGENKVDPADLEISGTISQYKVGNVSRSQERDIAKYWKKEDVRIGLLGLENQTSPDPDIALRVISYDGAAYRNEMNQGNARYPVVTLVLYFGTDSRWGQKSRSLYGRIGEPDKKLGSFFSDYRANVFEIAWLDDKTVAKFRSDFRIVADYFVQMRKNHKYVPSAETMVHVEEVLNLIAAVSGDKRFQFAQNENAERKVTKMEDWLTRALDKAAAEAAAKATAEANVKAAAKAAETLVNNVDSLMKKRGLSTEDACDALSHTVEEYLSAKKLLADAAAVI
ncbi:MAG: Rpn family recombination-promoting nuclease/putative transposase [Lachnospiraceae bacterium]|nr:Rpn family recombination-promoting nuclease/putative transposase [Lachnospiraceae bacterium]MCD8104071.1 Rpn family recombination-promoting nuclease/putative transposase [Lachnospiraceae bacterium]